MLERSERRNCDEVQVTAFSRLHFGLLSVRMEQGRQFGGVGMMIRDPITRIRFGSATSLSVGGVHAERVRQVAEHWSRFHDVPLRCAIHVEVSAELHRGLGLGTQLGLAVGKGLDVLHGRPDLGPEMLARSVGRGVRSAVGTYGFCHGGLIVESGKSSVDAISRLEDRIEVPDTWRFVLIDVKGSGLSGDEEQSVFDSVQTAAHSSTFDLRDELNTRLIPAARSGDFDRFAESLFQYGYHAGMLFAESQGGAYNGPAITELIHWLRYHGVHGVGQSSWGPTVYALCSSHDAASALEHELSMDATMRSYRTRISAPCNHSAIVTTTSHQSTSTRVASQGCNANVPPS